MPLASVIRRPCLAVLLHSLPAMKIRLLRTWMVSGFISLSVVACGKGLPNESTSDGTSTPVLGAAGIGTQCGLEGSVRQPTPQRLALWDCPLPITEVELTQAPPPIVVMADCQKKLFTVRNLTQSAGTRTDVTWEVNPDNTFNFTMDGGMIRLKTDGSGNDNCYTQLSMNMAGNLVCTGDRDKVTINFDSFLRPTHGTVAPGTSPSGKACALPAGCYFHTNASLKQCQ